MRRKTKQLASAIVMGAGALLLGGGLWSFFSPAAVREATRIAALPAMDPGAFQELPLGTEVLLQGALVAREETTATPEGFVAYREQYFLRIESQGASKGRETWAEKAVELPLIGVERAGQRVDGCDRDYLLVRPPHRWQSETTLRSADLLRPATQRRQGFKAGDLLTVDGRASRAGAGRCIEAKAIFGGGADDYREERRGDVLAMRVVGGIFGALGALLLALGVALRRSIRA